MIEALSERAGWKRGHRAIPKAGYRYGSRWEVSKYRRFQDQERRQILTAGGCERYRPDFGTPRVDTEVSGVPRMWISHEEKNMHRVCSNLATLRQFCSK
jgi:hypothetical protein